MKISRVRGGGLGNVMRMWMKKIEDRGMEEEGEKYGESLGMFEKGRR